MTSIKSAEVMCCGKLLQIQAAVATGNESNIIIIVILSYHLTDMQEQV